MHLPHGDVEAATQHRHGRHQQGSDKGSTARVWTRRHQRLWLLFHFSWRWLITAALVASLAGVLVVFQNKIILDSRDKHTFNFLITAFVIAIGVNFTGALSHFAGNGKWLFLSRTALPPRLFELVMGLDSQTNVMKLLWVAKGRWRIRVLCTSWLLLNVGVQALAALLGLTYQVVSPLQLNLDVIQAARGKASVVDLSFIGYGSSGITKDPRPGSPNYWNSQRAAANVYGQQTSTWGDIQYTQLNFFDAPSVLTNYYIKTTKEKWTWLIRFLDYPASQSRNIGVAAGANLESRRAIASTAKCNENPLLRGVKFGDTSTIDFTSEGRNTSILVPTNVWNSTTYMSDVRANYGSRNTRILVFWSGKNSTSHQPIEKLYDCTNHVSLVTHLGGEHPVRPELQLADGQARVIAGGIGWSEFNSNATFQSRTYSTNSRWNFNEPVPPWVVADGFISRFAIGSLNAMNFNGPRIVVDKVLYPNGGSVLSVRWVYAGTVLGLIAAVHLILLIIADLLLSDVLVRDDGFFATALFMRPLLNDMPALGGAMLKSREVADAIGSNLLTYTWDEQRETIQAEGTEHKQRVEGVRCLKAKAVRETPATRKRFENGLYD